MAEAVPAEELRYVVPFEARTKYVGADYVEQLAEAPAAGRSAATRPTSASSPALDALDGPTFDATRVHPLIREFYEHTSRFKLSIVPEWRAVDEARLRALQAPRSPSRSARPRSRRTSRRPSAGWSRTIDTISFDGEAIDIRGWIRTFADSGQPIYVGIYTSFRHEGRGYVSVGFPIPSSNFTATLQPHNVDGDGLLLTSQSDLEFPGHYLSAVEDGDLTVLKLLAFHEQIHVHVDDAELKTEHSFSLAGQRFLTLHYEIERL